MARALFNDDEPGGHAGLDGPCHEHILQGNEAGTPGWNGRLARTQVIDYDGNGNPIGGWPIADGITQGGPS